MDGGRREAEHGKVDHKESSDNEEVELLHTGRVPVGQIRRGRRGSTSGAYPPAGGFYDDIVVASYVDTWIVYCQRLLSGMLWTDVESGRVTQT